MSSVPRVLSPIIVVVLGFQSKTALTNVYIIGLECWLGDMKPSLASAHQYSNSLITGRSAEPALCHGKTEDLI